MVSRDTDLHYALMGDSKWSLYMLQRTDDYLQSADFNRKKMIVVSVVGRQQDSTTWVMGPNIQMDSDGSIIPEDRQEYYW